MRNIALFHDLLLRLIIIFVVYTITEFISNLLKILLLLIKQTHFIEED